MTVCVYKLEIMVILFVKLVFCILPWWKIFNLQLGYRIG
jgi:hypothetical protein